MKAEVYGREKALWAIYQKMVARRMSFSQVLDIYGFRVLVDDVPDCYLALGALHATYKPVPGRFKDYIAIPKVNGYQSLHTTLVGPFGTPIEFQIRTRDMQRVAEAGVAAHWLYKAEKETFSELQMRTHQWLKSLLDIQSQTGDSLEFIEHVKVDLFPDAVYVFTPRGQIRSLPRGATVIDFAYSVHTDIGDQAVTATVNQDSVPLRTELHNGDVVEVITDPNSQPNPAWLGFVRTGKARAEIRHSLRTMKHSESIDLGRRLLDQALAALRIDSRSMDPVALERGARDAGAKTVEELYEDIGLGKRLAPVVARTIALQFSTKPAAAALIVPPARADHGQRHRGLGDPVLAVLLSAAGRPGDRPRARRPRPGRCTASSARPPRASATATPSAGSTSSGPTRCRACTAAASRSSCATSAACSARSPPRSQPPRRTSSTCRWTTSPRRPPRCASCCRCATASTSRS